MKLQLKCTKNHTAIANSIIMNPILPVSCVEFLVVCYNDVCALPFDVYGPSIIAVTVRIADHRKV